MGHRHTVGIWTHGMVWDRTSGTSTLVAVVLIGTRVVAMHA